MNPIVERLNEELDLLVDESSPAAALRALHFSLRAISHGRSHTLERVPWVTNAAGEPNENERALALTIVHAAEVAVGRELRLWDDSTVAQVALTLANRAVRITTDHWGAGRRERATQYLSCSRLDPIYIEPRQELALWGGVEPLDVASLFSKLDADDLALIRLRVGGATWDECGQHFAIPETVVRQRWTRLLRKLRRIMDSNDGA